MMTYGTLFLIIAALNAGLCVSNYQAQATGLAAMNFVGWLFATIAYAVARRQGD